MKEESLAREEITPPRQGRAVGVDLARARAAPPARGRRRRRRLCGPLSRKGTHPILPGPFDRSIQRPVIFWATWRNEEPGNEPTFRVLEMVKTRVVDSDRANSSKLAARDEPSRRWIVAGAEPFRLSRRGVRVPPFCSLPVTVVTGHTCMTAMDGWIRGPPATTTHPAVSPGRRRGHSDACRTVPGPCAPKQAEAPLLSFNLLASFLPGGDVDHIYFASYPLYWPTLNFSRTHHSVLLAISSSVFLSCQISTNQ